MALVSARRDHPAARRRRRAARNIAEEDRQRREEAEVRNTADGLVYSTEKLLKEQAESFQGTEKEDVESALSALKETLSGTDTEAIKNATEKLLTTSQSFSQRLYEQAAQANNGEAAPQSNDEDIVDAEIVE